MSKESVNCSETYIDSLDWTKSKKLTISFNNDDDKCTGTVALNHEEIEKD